MAKRTKIVAKRRPARTRARPAVISPLKQKSFDHFRVFDCVKHVDQQTYAGVGVVIGAMLTDLGDEPLVCVRYRDSAFYWVTPSVLTYA